MPENKEELIQHSIGSVCPTMKAICLSVQLDALEEIDVRNIKELYHVKVEIISLFEIRANDETRATCRLNNTFQIIKYHPGYCIIG